MVDFLSLPSQFVTRLRDKYRSSPPCVNHHHHHNSSGMTFQAALVDSDQPQPRDTARSEAAAGDEVTLASALSCVPAKDHEQFKPVRAMFALLNSIQGSFPTLYVRERPLASSPACPAAHHHHHHLSVRKSSNIGHPTDFRHVVHMSVGSRVPVPSSPSPLNADWTEFTLFLALVEEGKFTALHQLVQCGQSLSGFVNRTCARQRDGERLEEWTALHTAAAHNTPDHARIVTLLLEHGAVPNARTVPIPQEFAGRTALHIAAQRNCVLTAQALLAHRGVDPNATACETCSTIEGESRSVFVSDRTALHVCADKNHARIAALLVEHGADPDMLQHMRVLGGTGGDRWREVARSAVHICCLNNHTATLRVLAPHCDVERCEQDRQWFGCCELTGLQLAVRRANRETACVMIQHGADLHLQDGDGVSAWHRARSNSFRNVLLTARLWTVMRLLVLGQRKGDHDCALRALPDDVLFLVGKAVARDLAS